MDSGDRVLEDGLLYRIGLRAARAPATASRSSEPVLAGMDLVIGPTIVPEEMPEDLMSFANDPPQRLTDGGHDMGSFDGGWLGMVNEFRNQLTIFLAGTNDLFAMLPSSVVAQFADTLDDMESSARFLQTLLTWMDASVGRGTQAICDVGDLLIRAKMLAVTGLSTRVSIRLDPQPAGVRNRGASIECALAALITELGHVSGPRPVQADAGASEGFEVRVSVLPKRGALSIVLASSAGQQPGGGWRVSLAHALLAQVGGSIRVIDRGTGRWSGFEVRFRFQ